MHWFCHGFLILFLKNYPLILFSLQVLLWCGKIFGSNLTKLMVFGYFFLHREIATAAQGDLSVVTYFNRLKLLWDEYVVLVPFSLVIVKRRGNFTLLFQQKLLQFLMGLNKTYSAIRSQILLMKPLHSVNQAYPMILQEGSSRLQLSGVSPISDPVVMYTSGVSTSRRRFNDICDFYKIKGHKRDQCYRLVGFPSDFKFFKKKKVHVVMNMDPSNATQHLVASTNSVAPVVVPSRVSLSAAAPIFTQTQYQQILELLHKPTVDPILVSHEVSAHSAGSL